MDLTKPSCFGNHKILDEDDAECQRCPHFDPCAVTVERWRQPHRIPIQTAEVPDEPRPSFLRPEHTRNQAPQPTIRPNVAPPLTSPRNAPINRIYAKPPESENVSQFRRLSRRLIAGALRGMSQESYMFWSEEDLDI